MPPALCAQFHR